MVKTICDFENCCARYVNIIGDCKYCKKKFCGSQRLPETHNCINLDNCKKNHFELNKQKVLGGECISKQISSI